MAERTPITLETIQEAAEVDEIRDMARRLLTEVVSLEAVLEATVRQLLDGSAKSVAFTLALDPSFVSKPSAKDVVMALVEVTNPKNWEIALENYNQYKSQPWTKSVVEICIEKNPALACRYLDQFGSESWIAEMLLAAAGRAPRAILDSNIELGNFPYGKEVLVCAAMINHGQALRIAAENLDMPFRDEVIDAALESSMARLPGVVPDGSPRIAEIRNTRVMVFPAHFRRLAKRNPDKWWAKIEIPVSV